MSAEESTPNKPPARPPLFMKQKVMLRMVYALVPVLIAAIYFFGWRCLGVLVVSWAVGLATEYITSRQRGQSISMANFVTCWLFALSLPPLTPMWVVAVGTVVAILFGKEVFGGFGRNFANPAIVGRAFVYVAFPVPMTAQFVPVFKGFPGGFAHWSFRDLSELPQYIRDLPQYAQLASKNVADAITQASPMWVQREFSEQAIIQGGSAWDAVLGNIGGLFQTSGGDVRVLAAGSMGEGCELLIILSAVYLLWTKTANWRLMLGGFLGLLGGSVLFHYILGLTGLGGVPPLVFTLFQGTTLYAIVYMVTEPVSAPKRKAAIWVYSILIGFLIVLLRWKGIFVAAASFAILLGNIIAPLLDIGATWQADRAKARKAAAKVAREPAA